MKNVLCTMSWILLPFLAAPVPCFGQELFCIGDYKGRGADQGFYWFFVDLKVNNSLVEKLSWETSYASDLAHAGRSCKVETAGFLQTRQKDGSILLVDPQSRCSISLTPKKNERNTFLLTSEGCGERFCTDKGVLPPLTVHMASRKCVPQAVMKEFLP